MINSDRNTVLMFNGEIYNHTSLRKDLEKDGIKFKSDHSDSEVVLNGLSYYGNSFVDKLVGQFSIAFYRSNSRNLTLIRDRVGQKPLFFANSRSDIVFGSNLISVADLSGDKQINEKQIGDFFNCGVNVITSGNHVWDQKEIMSYIDKENRLLRPYNLFEPSPGKGFEIFKTSNNISVGVLNLMGNVFMKKCEDVFETAKKFLKNNVLKQDYDLLIVDFHGEITSEKNAIGHYFDGKATLVIGTHTHIPTNDARIFVRRNLLAWINEINYSDEQIPGVINTIKGKFFENLSKSFENDPRTPPRPSQIRTQFLVYVPFFLDVFEHVSISVVL